MHWIEATRGDGRSTGALEFEVSVEIRIWGKCFKSKCVADILWLVPSSRTEPDVQPCRRI